MTPEELQNSIEELQNKVVQLEKRQINFEAHDHYITGGAPLRLKGLLNFGLQSIVINLFNTMPVSPNIGNYDTIFVSDFDMEVVSVSVSMRQKGTDTPTMDIYKLTTGQARASGVTILSSVFDIGSTATDQTPVRKAATATKANRILKRGDRLALVDIGTLTSVNQLTICIYYLPL